MKLIRSVFLSPSQLTSFTTPGMSRVRWQRWLPLTARALGALIAIPSLGQQLPSADADYLMRKR